MNLKLIRQIRAAFSGDNQRINILCVFFVIMFIVVINRLFDLQIVHGQYYEDNYVQKTIKDVTIPAARGIIYDKNGKVLAYNELVKNITIADIDAYPQTTVGINKRNRMLLNLANILKKYDSNIDSKYFVELDDKGNFFFTTETEKQHRTFIANVYGRLIADLDEGQNFRFRSDISAKEAFEYSKKRYAMDMILDDEGIPIIIDNKTLLDMIGIHYTMRLTSYQKYQPTTIAQRVSSRCATEILENKGQLLGVEVEETSRRRYNYALYFSHIIGYVGRTSERRINELKQKNPQYDINDMVGLLGIEKYMEEYLCGIKGYRRIIVDSSGKILETLEENEPKSGNDVYLTISIEDQVANYHLAEQQLAGIVASKIENRDVDNGRADGSTMMISATDAYYKLIANNVLDKEHFYSINAKYAEKEIYRIFLQEKENVRGIIYKNLMDPRSPIQKDLTTIDQNYLAYVYTYLHTHNNILMSDAIDRDVEEYILWKQDEISLRNFLIKAIEEMWIDTTKIYATDRYGDRDTIYENLVNYIMGELVDNETFDLLVYRLAIKQKFITNRLLLMALYEQEFLEFDEGEYDKISKGNDEYLFTYFIRLIRDLRLKPADLALDPCRASILATDVNSGKVKVMVSYPSYDNNLVANRKYFNSVNNNSSLPLVNISTQTNLAPGSSFKPITAVAALEEYVIVDNYTITCDGIFDEIDPPIRCWAYPYSHGTLTLIEGMKYSCNVFFASLGHYMSLDYDKNYSTDIGLRKLIKYAEMFGLGKKSGIELDELAPTISRQDPERSAMGQGTHAFNNAQLSKYTVALANGGRVYELSILDKVVDKNGNIIKQYEDKLVETLNLKKENIQTVKDGMREVITDGVARFIFRKQGLQICGKTGTAQERKDRPNHGVFVSFCPYYNPELAVNVVIPFGYSSGNAAALANKVYDYMYNTTTFDEVINRNADNIRSVSVSD